MDFGNEKLKGKIDLGEKSFNEQEIIEFAKNNDPLAFHINIETAKKSIFKGLVCSGSQAFNYFYVNSWIPKFGNNVIAGLSVNNWNFIAPIYANKVISSNCHISKKKKAKKNNNWVVTWNFEFNVDKEKVQELELTILMTDQL